MTTTTNNSNSNEVNTMSTTEQIRAAQQAADNARDYARKLQAEADKAEAERKAHREAATLEFHRTRQTSFAKITERINERRTAFEQAVISDHDHTRAWIDYMGAIHAAASEERRSATALYEHALTGYEAIAKQVSQWNDELAHLNVTKQAGTPLAGLIRTRDWWSSHVPGLPPAAMEKIKKANSRIEQLNLEINETSKALGKPLNRELTDTESVLIPDIAIKPSEPRLSTGEVSKWERRTMTQAVAQIIEQQIKAEAKQLGNEYAADLAQFIENYEG